MALIPQGEAWQSLVFGETVCQTLAMFLNHNLERLLLEEKATTTPGTLEYQLLVRCLQLMTELLRLPSLKAAVGLVPGWSLILKLDKLKGLGVLEPLLPVVMAAYCDKVSHPPTHLPSHPPIYVRARAHIHPPTSPKPNSRSSSGMTRRAAPFPTAPWPTRSSST